MTDEAVRYSEQFVERAGLGYRYRIFSADGIVDIRYQEWNEETKLWNETGKADGLPMMDMPKIIEALQALEQDNEF